MASLFLINSVFAATIRDNPFYFYLESGVTSFEVTYENSMVTSGQPYEPKFITNTYLNDGKVLYLVFRAGRHKSSPVAKQFYENLGSDSHMYNPFAAQDESPRELNFFIQTRLKINGSPLENSFYIAQGSNFFSGTNGWLGSKSGTNDNNAYFRVTTQDNKQYDIIDLGCSVDDKRICFSVSAVK